MTILATELRNFRSAVFNDTPSNGGRLSDVEVISGTVGNLFQEAGSDERAAGSIKYRKTFYKIEKTGLAETLFNARLYVEAATPGEDELTFFLGSQTNVQSDITGAETHYGAGFLNADANISDTSITVAVSPSSPDQFRPGELIRISNKTSIADLGGITEFATLVTANRVADVWTLTLTAGLQNAFLQNVTKVASVYEFGDLVANYTSFLVTSTAGTYDDAGNPVELSNQGAIEQNWTLTFTSATAYTVVGDTVGSVGSGNISSDLSPTNPGNGEPYFTLRAAGWGGTFVSGDTLTFTTRPGAVPIWHQRTIPAGAGTQQPNDGVVVFDGES